MNTFQHLAFAAILLFVTQSCSSTPKLVSQFDEEDATGSGAADLEQKMQNVDRKPLDEIAVFAKNDEKYLYLMVDFISSRAFDNAREFGFTLYIDGKDAVKRSFGITYPTGIFYELRSYPGAQKGYLQEPNWGNMQQNQNILESAERTSKRNALIVQRRSRRDNIQPFSLPLNQLQAQNLLVHFDEEGRNGRISFTIPLQTRSTSQFSPDIEPGQVVDVGFEIDPIRLHDMREGSSAPLITSETASGRTQSESDEQQQERINRVMHRLGEPMQKWVKLELSAL